MADRISHDQNFKNLILDYPRDALFFFAAPEAPSPEDSVQITPIRQELLQERFGAHYRGSKKGSGPLTKRKTKRGQVHFPPTPPPDNPLPLKDTPSIKGHTPLRPQE